MLALLSPAKRLDVSHTTGTYTHPQFLDRSQSLIDRLKSLSREDIQTLMKLSDSLTDLNIVRYNSYQVPFTIENSKQAIFAFKGDTYIGLDAESLSEDDILFAQDSIRIVSGLYGLLRPLDLIFPYRLEMGAKLENKNGKDLYKFWGESLAESCNLLVKKYSHKAVVNLASNEYIKAVPQSKIETDFINCQFKELRDGTPKTIGIFAKKARGMMARHIIKKRVETPSDLKGFSEAGYQFNSDLSGERDFIFVR